jgi:xylose isomerase
MAGAGTNPSPDVFAFAAAKVKKALEITHELDGAGYVFWGGREGYDTLLNTDMKRELDHLALFLKMAVDYKRRLDLRGNFILSRNRKNPQNIIRF